MLPRRGKRSFVPPLKGDSKSNSDNFETYSQFSYTQSQESYGNDISFFSNSKPVSPAPLVMSILSSDQPDQLNCIAEEKDEVNISKDSLKTSQDCLTLTEDGIKDRSSSPIIDKRCEPPTMNPTNNNMYDSSGHVGDPQPDLTPDNVYDSSDHVNNPPIIQLEQEAADTTTVPRMVKRHCPAHGYQEKRKGIMKQNKQCPSGYSTSRARAKNVYKFAVGKRNISRISLSKAISTTSSCGPQQRMKTLFHNKDAGRNNNLDTNGGDTRSVGDVFDFPISQANNANNDDGTVMDQSNTTRHSLQSKPLATTDTASTWLRTREERSAVVDEVLSIVSQIREDIQSIKRKHNECLADPQFMRDLTQLLRQSSSSTTTGSLKKRKEISTLSFFIAGHEE